jgi:DNA-binding MarR family transcriptional regulator
MQKFISKDKNDLRFQDLLPRLMRSLHAGARSHALRLQLSLSELQTLFLLSNGKPVEMNKIKNKLLISGAFATDIADRLVRRKLVLRQRDDKDRRKVTIMLTDKGKHYLAKLEVKRQRFFKALVNGLKEEDKRIMERGVSMFVDSLESMKDFNE